MNLLHRLVFAWSLCAALASNAAFAAEPARPNVVIVLADDLGYSDLGCYGGEIETPALDRLAAGGLRFTSFYNTGRCWPTRTSLVTGLYPHQAHNAMRYGPNAPPAYSGQIPDSVPMLSQLLAPLGYRSYHSGKWHLDGRGETNRPLDRGFAHSYFMQQQDNYFRPRRVLDDATLHTTFPDDYYATDAIADRAVDHLRGHARDHAGEPFFVYLAYTAPHFPLHARADDVAHYLGRYREGWDAVRQARYERLRSLGAVDCELSPRDPDAAAWDSLSTDEQIEWDTRMAVHAAMITCLDRGVERVVEQLEAMQALDNTLILFLSDNGASAEFIVRGDGHREGAEPGAADSYRCMEVGWANASNTPFRYHKIWVHEGGIATPLVAHWPRGIPARSAWTTQVGHVIDLVPTILELAGATYPTEAAGEATTPLPGRSLAATLTDGATVPRDMLFWEHSGNRALRLGDWKLVATRDGEWELYNLADDRSELHDQASEQPERLQQMIARWQAFADETGVVDWHSLPQSQGRPARDYREK